MKALLRATLLLLAALVCTPQRVEASLDFSFSITNTDALGVPGTVTGRILGLSDNSTGAAAQVLIDSVPSAINTVPVALPVDATGPGWNIGANSFTTLSGQIVAASFSGHETVHPPSGFYLLINAGNNGANFVSLDPNAVLHFVQGYNGSAGVVFAPLNAAPPTDPPTDPPGNPGGGDTVPEPSTLALFLLGLPFAYRSARRRRA